MRVMLAQERRKKRPRRAEASGETKSSDAAAPVEAPAVDESEDIPDDEEETESDDADGEASLDDFEEEDEDAEDVS